MGEAAANPLWQEGEAFTSTTAKPGTELTRKPPASGGMAVAGAVFIKAGNEVRYDLVLSQPIPEPKVLLRFARLHFRDSMPPARLRVTVSQSGRQLEADLTCGDTGGWGTLKAGEWAFAEADLGAALEAGPLRLRITALEDNSNVNLDGFYLAPASFAVSREETRGLERIRFDSGGYAGLAIGGDTVFPGAFDGFALRVRRIQSADTTVAAFLVGADGKRRTILEETAPSPSEAVSGTRVPASALDLYPDGQYTLEAAFSHLPDPLAYPLSIMGGRVARARAQAAAWRETAGRFRAGAAPAEQALVPDLEHAAEYVEKTILLLEARQRGEAAASEWVAALAYFERSPERTAQAFAEDLESLMAQTAQSLEQAAAGADPYAGRHGDFRRAFISEAKGILEPYRIFVPEAYDQQDSIPLLLMLHGGGGDENYFPDIDGGTVRKVLSSRPHVMLSPRSTQWFEGDGLKDLRQLIAETLRAYPKIDPRRITCTGVSRGGTGTFNMAMAFPGLFSAIACVSAGPRITNDATRLGRLPILLIQGGTDVVVPPERSRQSAEELRKRGMIHQLEVFPDYGHEYHAGEYLNLTLDFFEKHAGG